MYIISEYAWLKGFSVKKLSFLKRLLFCLERFSSYFWGCTGYFARVLVAEDCLPGGLGNLPFAIVIIVSSP